MLIDTGGGGGIVVVTMQGVIVKGVVASPLDATTIRIEAENAAALFSASSPVRKICLPHNTGELLPLTGRPISQL